MEHILTSLFFNFFLFKLHILTSNEYNTVIGNDSNNNEEIVWPSSFMKDRTVSSPMYVTF